MKQQETSWDVDPGPRVSLHFDPALQLEPEEVCSFT